MAAEYLLDEGTKVFSGPSSYKSSKPYSWLWTSAMIEDTTFLNLRARLAKRLLALAQSHGTKLPGDGGVKLNLRLSQRQLGAMIDASREAVNKQVQHWRADGILDVDQGLLVLRKPEWLEAIIG